MCEHKLFESQEHEIHEFMMKHELQKYQITSNGVDVHSGFHLYNYNLHELPFQFNEIHGNFTCSHNKLESLQGAPRVVHGTFYCKNNKITSLSGAPKVVEGDFYCSGNNIEPWEHRYLLFSEIHGRIQTDSYELDKFFQKYQNKKAGIPEALKELKVLQKQWEQEK